MSLKPYSEYKDSGVEWLGSVPAEWLSTKLSRHIVINSGLVDPKSEPFSEMIMVAPNHIESWTGRIKYTETARQQGAESGKYQVYKGQVIYSKIRPNLMKVVIAPFDCLCSADMYGLEADGNMLSNEFLTYYLLSHEFHDYAVDQSARVAMPKLNHETLKATPIFLPPFEDQWAVTNYLDRETTEIDAFIADQEELIALLGERRKSALHTVTASVKDAPKIRLRYLYRQSRAANRTDLDVLSVYRDHGVIPKSSRSDNFNKTPEDISRYLVVRPEYLVVNKMKAWQGSLGVSSHDGIVSPDYEVLAPLTNDLNSAYTHHMLRSAEYVAEYAVRSVGIRPSQWRLYWDQLKDITIPVPNKLEQLSFLKNLQEETAEIDAAITDAREAIALSKERRAAVISAAVTGKIDLRGFQTPVAANNVEAESVGVA